MWQGRKSDGEWTAGHATLTRDRISERQIVNFEPQKFFIGLMDFFSILLPGALLTYLLMGEVGPVVLGYEKYQAITGAEGVAVFIVTSYLLGHIVFLLGAWWLDELYDWVRRYTLNKQIVLLARRGRLLSRFARALIWLLFMRERNLAVDRAGKIKEQTLKGLGAKNAVNTFQWSKAVLNIDSPASLAVVQRFEADSKFFRSFAVVLFLLAASLPFHRKWPWESLGVMLALFLLALWRYMEQRYKATNQAYWAVITLTAQGGKVVVDKDKAAPAASGLTHAGGVVYRMRGGQAEYLLVEAKNDPNQWVLPKGHIEEAEHPRETAVREVHEETGVWANICADLNGVSYSVDGRAITARFFLMEYAGRSLRSDVNREHIWLPLTEAIVKAGHPETRDLLKSAPDAIELLILSENRS